MIRYALDAPSLHHHLLIFHCPEAVVTHRSAPVSSPPRLSQRQLCDLTAATPARPPTNSVPFPDCLWFQAAFLLSDTVSLLILAFTTSAQNPAKRAHAKTSSPPCSLLAQLPHDLSPHFIRSSSPGPSSSDSFLSSLAPCPPHAALLSAHPRPGHLPAPCPHAMPLHLTCRSQAQRPSPRPPSSSSHTTGKGHSPTQSHPPSPEHTFLVMPALLLNSFASSLQTQVRNFCIFLKRPKSTTTHPHR